MNFFYRDVTDINQVSPNLLLTLPSRRITKNVWTHLPPRRDGIIESSLLELATHKSMKGQHTYLQGVMELLNHHFWNLPLTRAWKDSYSETSQKKVS